MNQSSEEDDDMPALIPVQENQSSEEDDDMPALIPAQENTQSDISANGGMAVENNELYNLRRSQRRGGVYLASRTVRLRGRPRADGRVSPVTNTTVAEGMQMTAMAAAAFFGTQMSDVSTVRRRTTNVRRTLSALDRRKKSSWGRFDSVGGRGAAVPKQ